MEERVKHSQDAMGPAEYMRQQMVGQVVYVVNTDRYHQDLGLVASYIGGVHLSEASASKELVDQGYEVDGQGHKKPEDERGFYSYGYIMYREVE